MIQPRGDRVLIQRIEPCRYGDPTCPCQDGDMCHYEGPKAWPKPKGSILLTDAPKGIKGVVVAVGPGKRDEDGDLVPLDVKPGDKVLFNSKWNDFSAAEHGRPLPLGHDEKLHLVQEADIFAKVPHFNFTASINYEGALNQTFMQHIELPPNGNI